MITISLTAEIPSTTTAHAKGGKWARIEWQLPKGTFPLPCVSITLWISFPDQKIRDNQNILVAFKGFVDGMVDAGMIKDDNNQVVVSIAARTLEFNSPRPGVTILVEPAAAAPIIPKLKAKKVSK